MSLIFILVFWSVDRKNQNNSTMKMRHILSIQYELRVIILSICHVFFIIIFFSSYDIRIIHQINFIRLDNIDNKKQGRIIYLFEDYLFYLKYRKNSLLSIKCLWLLQIILIIFFFNFWNNDWITIFIDNWISILFRSKKRSVYINYTTNIRGEFFSY